MCEGEDPIEAKSQISITVGRDVVVACTAGLWATVQPGLRHRICIDCIGIFNQREVEIESDPTIFLQR